VTSSSRYFQQSSAATNAGNASTTSIHFHPDSPAMPSKYSMMKPLNGEPISPDSGSAA
jgi:hypothetical protein